MSTSIQGEGGRKAVDVSKFLKENRLERATKAFLEREIAIEELTEFAEDELADFATDLGLDTLQRKRFIKAIIALRPDADSNNPNQPSSETTTSYPSQTLNTSPSVFSRASSKPLNSDLHHVMLSRDENKAMKKLFARFDKTMILGKELESSFKTLGMASENCKGDINSQIEVVMNVLEDKKKQLLTEIETLKSSKEEKLRVQLDALEDHRKGIANVSFPFPHPFPLVLPLPALCASLCQPKKGVTHA